MSKEIEPSQVLLMNVTMSVYTFNSQSDMEIFDFYNNPALLFKFIDKITKDGVSITINGVHSPETVQIDDFNPVHDESVFVVALYKSLYVSVSDVIQDRYPEMAKWIEELHYKCCNCKYGFEYLKP